MKDFLKRTFKSMFIVAVLTIVLGLILIIWPSSAAQFLSKVLGWIILIAGIVWVVLYFTSSYSGTNTTLFLALILTAFGFWSVIKPGVMAELISVLMGILLITHGFLNIQDALELKQSYYDRWWIYLLFGVLTAILGFFVIWSPIQSLIAMTIITGIALIFDGVTDIIFLIKAGKVVRSLELDR